MVQIFPIIVLILSLVLFAANKLPWFYSFLIFTIMSFLYIIILKLIDSGKLYTEQFGAYFIVQKYPWSRYYFIGQRKGIEQSPDKSCRQIIADFSKQGDIALSKMKNGRTYLMYTQTTVVRRLRRVPQFKLTEFNDRSTLPLMPNFKELTGRNCDKCPTSTECFSLKLAKRNTNFSTVKIEVK